MFDYFAIHNRFRESLNDFLQSDPQLVALAKLKYQYSSCWWETLSLSTPGIYILTGGRQIGKSTSCKLLLEHCLKKRLFTPTNLFYMPCDEIYDAVEFSKIIRAFLEQTDNQPFLLIIDEVTFVKDWDRVIKAVADEGWFQLGLCLLTGSDTLILKEAAMRFPGRRGVADQTDFHVYPLSFREYVDLVNETNNIDFITLSELFNQYLTCGGYLRAINDLASNGQVQVATQQTYMQWVRGDFLKRGKSEETLLNVLQGLFTNGVSQVSYSKLTQNIGLISKETLIDYCRLLERMDILFNLAAFDQNKQQGFPRKDRKFHFQDPFIQRTMYAWLHEQGLYNKSLEESHLVEACVASHCYRQGKVYYFKGQGEIDVILLRDQKVEPIEVKWSEQLRANDLKMLKHFPNSMILTKQAQQGEIDGIQVIPVYQFLYTLG